MAKTGEKILADDYNQIYTRLDAVRGKWGLDSIDYQVTQNQIMQSSSMIQLQSDLSLTSKESKFVVTTSYNIGNIKAGDIAKYATIDVVDGIIVSFESACIDYSNNASHRTDCGDNVNHSNRSSYCGSDRTGYSTSCSNYSNYSNNSSNRSGYSSSCSGNNSSDRNVGPNCSNNSANKSGYCSSNCSAVYNATNSYNGNWANYPSNWRSHNTGNYSSNCSSNYSQGSGSCSSNNSSNRSSNYGNYSDCSNYSQGTGCSANYTTDCSNYTDTQYD